MFLCAADYQDLLNTCDSGLIALNENKEIIFCNQWVTERTKINTQEILEKDLNSLFEKDVDHRLIQAIDSALNFGQSSFISPRLHQNVIPLYRNSSNNTHEPLPYLKISIKRLESDIGGRIVVIYIEDQTPSITREMKLHQNAAELKATERKLLASEKEIRDMAFYDNLTGLANRHLFSETMKVAINQSRRNKKKACLMIIDIDFFKDINDTYGHDIGDYLLRKMSEKIKSCIRTSDTAARLGGDEFAVIFWGIDKPDYAYTLAEKLVHEISKPVVINDVTINPSCSIGISFYPDDAITPEELYKNSDVALYDVKRNGRSAWKPYSREMRYSIERKHSIKDHLVQGIKHDRIVTLYQPIMDLKNHCAKGMEALTRLKINETYMSPVEFIPVAEEFGLINDITDCAIRDIIDKIPIWKNMNLNTLSINLSSIQFRDHAMISKLNDAHGILNDHGIELQVEITESILMENIKAALENLTLLTRSGISIALDDFGTGYSSLEYLSKLPINRLKVDKSFVNNISLDGIEDVITNTVISLGHNLGMEVIAEGVETLGQQQYLMDKNCDYVQGYLYSKPIEIKHAMHFETMKKVA